MPRLSDLDEFSENFQNGGSKAVWSFSENSSKSDSPGIPNLVLLEWVGEADNDQHDQGSGSAVHQLQLVLSLNRELFRAMGEKSTPVR